MDPEIERLRGAFFEEASDFLSTIESGLLALEAGHASPDVIHGLLITGTNVNTMVVPGFVAQVHTEFARGEDLLMPCHEYCGLGHSEMWATVQVMPDDKFTPGPDGRVSCAQR